MTIEARSTSLPRYEGIIKGAALLKKQATSLGSIAAVFYILGVASAASIFIVYANFRIGNVAQQNVSSLIVLSICGVPIFLTLGRWFRIRSILLRLQAELALAQRDIAINSFRIANV